jgi:uncharacterized membrane-anchored protein
LARVDGKAVGFEAFEDVGLLAMIGLSVGIQVDVKLVLGTSTNSSRKEFTLILEYLSKIIALSWDEEM